MNFSAEEIYFQFGQYDKFLEVKFHYNSEAFKELGPKLLGTFIYTLDERIQLEDSLKLEDIPRTNSNIKFKPSELERLTSDQKIRLDKTGFKCADIYEISYLKTSIENKFKAKGEREIPNTIKVEFDPSGLNGDRFTYSFLLRRFSNGHELIPYEKIELYGMLLFYNPDLAKKHKTELTNVDNEDIEMPVDFFYKRSKFKNDKASQDDINDIIEYYRVRDKQRVHLLVEEIKRSSQKFKEIAKSYKEPLDNLLLAVSTFDNQLIVLEEFPVWWDFERFLHIYCRHVKETKVGERFDEKTIFSYKYNDIQRVIKNVVENVYPEMFEHFKKSDSNFRRMGSRSVYYDGVYYRIEISKTGKIISFHPYNDDKSS